MAYSPELAHKCAALSAQVYQPYFDENCPSVANDPNQAFFSIGKTQVWLINEPDAVFVVFRGTSYEDMMTDAKVRRVETKYGGIHRGFYAYVQNTVDQVDATLSKWSEKPIVLTGHSLGAAAAVIQACILHADGHEIAAVYTYGEPRVGNSDFVDCAETAFGDIHYRHFNGLDGVPMIPFWHWGYRHCGQRFYFSTTRQRLVRNAPLCQVVLEHLPILLFKPWKWALYKALDHPVYLYVAGCERNL